MSMVAGIVPSAGGHIMRDAPIQPHPMSPEDMKVLQDACSECHTLNRVFWTRGTRKTWEAIIAEEQHEKNGWNEEKKESFYKVFRNFPIKAPWMDPSDKEYLEEQCTVCHTLNRVFWNRGPEEMWKSILDQKQHQEAKIGQKIKNIVYSILKQYMNEDGNQS